MMRKLNWGIGMIEVVNKEKVDEVIEEIEEEGEKVVKIGRMKRSEKEGVI